MKKNPEYATDTFTVGKEESDPLPKKIVCGLRILGYKFSYNLVMILDLHYNNVCYESRKSYGSSNAQAVSSP